MHFKRCAFIDRYFGFKGLPFNYKGSFKNLCRSFIIKVSCKRKRSSSRFPQSRKMCCGIGIIVIFRRYVFIKAYILDLPESKLRLYYFPIFVFCPRYYVLDYRPFGMFIERAIYVIGPCPVIICVNPHIGIAHPVVYTVIVPRKEFFFLNEPGNKH